MALREHSEEDASEAIGSRNDEQVSLREEIARRSEVERTQKNPDGEGEDFEDIEEDGTRSGDETPSPDQPTERAEVPDDEDPDGEYVDKHVIKVGGKELTLTTQELIARAQKVEAADQYLEEAKKALTKTQEPPPSQDVGVDYKALARALQMGTEDEAAEAIRKFASPSVKPDVIVNNVKAQLAFEDAAQWVQGEYQDLFADADLKQLFMAKDQAALANGDSRSYRERYKAIGDELRGKYLKRTDKLSRKEKVVPITQASVRKKEAVEDDREPSPSEVIAQMAASRGQRS